MNNDGDDFDNVELGNEDMTHHGGEFNDDADDPPPARAQRSAPSRGASGSRIIRLAMLGGIVILIGGGGYAAYEYVASSYLTPAAPRHVQHSTFPAGNGGSAHPNPGQATAFPASNSAPAPTGFPPASPSGFPAADQNAAARALPPLGGNDREGLPAADHSEAPGFPEDVKTAPATGGGIVPPHLQAANLNGFAAPGQAPTTAPDPSQQESLISTLNSNVVKVLSDKADVNHIATMNAVKAGTEDVKSEVDARSDDLSNKITALQVSTTQLMAKVEALTERDAKQTQAAPSKAPPADSHQAGALRRPAAGHRQHVIHPGKPAEPVAAAAPAAAQVPAWHLRGLGNGFVVLQKDGRYVPVLIGKPLPDGSGIVEGVGKKDGKTIVRTSTGIIQE